MEAVICAMIAAAGTIAVALIEARAAKDRKRAEAQATEDRERVERRARVREQESRLSMEMMSATCALSLVAAKKLTGHQTNGDVEAAMEKARNAQSKYVDFLRDTAAHQVAKT